MLYVLFCCGYQLLITLTFYTLCAAAVLSSQSYCMISYVRRTLLKRMSASFMMNIAICIFFIISPYHWKGMKAVLDRVKYPVHMHVLYIPSHTFLIEGSSWQHLVARIRIESEIQPDNWRRFSSCLSLPAVL